MQVQVLKTILVCMTLSLTMTMHVDAFSTLFNVLLETLSVKPSTWCDCISHCKDSS